MNSDGEKASDIKPGWNRKRDDHDGALRRNRAHPGRAALGGYPHRAERHYGDGMSRRAIYVWADEFMTGGGRDDYLSNAIHYAGGKKEFHPLQGAEKNVRISVFNTGDPIPEEDIDKIWSKFYKVDKARTREYGGSGIGLSIVKAIMDSFHQQCGVINHEDGVEFWFELEKGKQS